MLHRPGTAGQQLVDRLQVGTADLLGRSMASFLRSDLCRPRSPYRRVFVPPLLAEIMIRNVRIERQPGSP